MDSLLCEFVYIAGICVYRWAACPYVGDYFYFIDGCAQRLRADRTQAFEQLSSYVRCQYCGFSFQERLPCTVPHHMQPADYRACCNRNSKRAAISISITDGNEDVPRCEKLSS